MGDNIGDARNAAKKTPSARTTEEQGLVDRNWGDQQVRNNDHDAKVHAKIYGD